jgi:hypothetical protein
VKGFEEAIRTCKRNFTPSLSLSSLPPSLSLPSTSPPPNIVLPTDICSVVDVSYQSVQLDLLRDYLGGLDDDSLSQLAASRGWQTVTREDGTKMMEIRKQEATIKPKKILAKIDFDSKFVFFNSNNSYCFTYLHRRVGYFVSSCCPIDKSYPININIIEAIKTKFTIIIIIIHGEQNSKLELIEHIPCVLCALRVLL